MAYIDVGSKCDEETFDFMLKRVENPLPINLQLALRHEGKKVSERTNLMRKQDRYLRRILPKSHAKETFLKGLYERPLSEVVRKYLNSNEKDWQNK